MSEGNKPKIQGEGDYEGARRYRRGVEDYVKTADIDRAAHDAAPADAEEARKLEEAEAIGKSHAKGAKRQDKRGKDQDKEPRGPR